MDTQSTMKSQETEVGHPSSQMPPVRKTISVFVRRISEIRGCVVFAAEILGDTCLDLVLTILDDHRKWCVSKGLWPLRPVLPRDHKGGVHPGRNPAITGVADSARETTRMPEGVAIHGARRINHVAAVQRTVEAPAEKAWQVCRGVTTSCHTLVLQAGSLKTRTQTRKERLSCHGRTYRVPVLAGERDCRRH